MPIGAKQFPPVGFLSGSQTLFSAYWRMAEKAEAIRAENRGENHCEFGSLMV